MTVPVRLHRYSFRDYLGVEEVSLQAVVYLWQDRRHIEVRSRMDDGRWRSSTAGPGDRLPVAGVATLEVDSLYTSTGG
jgi:hypothetical protein